MVVRIFDDNAKPIPSIAPGSIRLFPDQSAPVPSATPIKFSIKPQIATDTQPLVPASNVSGASKKVQNVSDVLDTSKPDTRSTAVKIIDTVLGSAMDMSNPQVIAKLLYDSAYVPPKDDTTREKLKSIGYTLMNTPAAVIAQFVAAPILSTAATIGEIGAASKGKDMQAGLSGTIKLFGNSRGVDYAGAQAVYNKAIQNGAKGDTALIDSLLHMGMNAAIAIPLARNAALAATQAISPRSLLETMDITRQNVADILADRPVDPKKLGMFKMLSPEMKLKAAKGLLSLAPKATPSLLGKILGLSEEQASILAGKALVEISKQPVHPYGGELPGYAYVGEVPKIKAGLALQQMQRVGGAPEVSVTPGALVTWQGKPYEVVSVEGNNAIIADKSGKVAVNVTVPKNDLTITQSSKSQPGEIVPAETSKVPQEVSLAPQDQQQLPITAPKSIKEFNALPNDRQELAFSKLPTKLQNEVMYGVAPHISEQQSPIMNLADEIANGKQFIAVGKKMAEWKENLGNDYRRVFRRPETGLQTMQRLAAQQQGIPYKKKLSASIPAAPDELVGNLNNRHGTDYSESDLVDAVQEAFNRKRQRAIDIADERARLIDESKKFNPQLKTENQRQAYLAKLNRDIYRNITKKRYTIGQMSKVKARAEEKIASVKTAKQVLENRRRIINTVRDFFGMSDADLRSISNRDIRLMSNLEFKKFIDDLRIKADTLASTREGRVRLAATIQHRELVNTDNLRQAMKLPTIPNMTTAQLDQFNEELSKAQVGDNFLSVRKLETVDKTDLKGIKTLREARERLASEIGVPVESLDNIKVGPLDRYRYDTALAEKNPFYGLMVDTVNKSVLNAEARFLEVEHHTNELVNAARKSRKRTLVNRVVPQDKEIFEYLEAPTDRKRMLAATMTKEELEAALYIQAKYAAMRDYLVQFGALQKYRENYVTHIRRGFLEEWKETSLLGAMKNVFKQYQLEEAVFNIIDDTGNILPLEKFFSYSMRRSGVVEPTKNIANAFLAYTKAFEKKAALDAMVPKLDIYAHSLTPIVRTPRGLAFDRTLKTFVNEWLNTKKGRTAKIVGIEQGGRIDLILRAGKAMTSMIDLGLNIPVGIGSKGGENMTNFVMLGPKGYAKGLIRARTAQGKAIIESYKNFVGRTPFEELADAQVGLLGKFSKILFGLFKDANVRANKTFLLGSLTPEEFSSGVVNPNRLAELKREMGRYRVVEGAKSVVGSTSVGGVLTQYKGWAVPPLRTMLKNISTLIRTRNFTGREGQELLRATLAIFVVVALGKAFVDQKDKSFLGLILTKAYQDALTLIGALDPKTILSTPRLVQFLADLGTATSQIVHLEKYKTSDELKGKNALMRALTPRILKLVLPEDYGTAQSQSDGSLKEKSGTGKGSLKESGSGLPSMKGL